ncbi:unnamed protein product [Ilex paraguariensis]|uniref:Glycine-rich protein n=1 Tax=Ilex paraguariensis TaxID=185542 RepID=A0ABC8R5X6_9AQUA
MRYFLGIDLILALVGIGGCPSTLGKAMETLRMGKGAVGSGVGYKHGLGNRVCGLGDGINFDGSLRLGGSLCGRLGTRRVDPCMGEIYLGTETPLREIDGLGCGGDRGTTF